jgi:hypothetical protein
MKRKPIPGFKRDLFWFLYVKYSKMACDAFNHPYDMVGSMNKVERKFYSRLIDSQKRRCIKNSIKSGSF